MKLTGLFLCYQRIAAPCYLPDPVPNPSDPLPIGDPEPTRREPPIGDPAPTRRGGSLTCEFCECKLSSSGEVLKLSDTAKGYRDAEFDYQKECKRLKERLSALETENADLKRPREVASGRRW